MDFFWPADYQKCTKRPDEAAALVSLSMFAWSFRGSFFSLSLSLFSELYLLDLDVESTFNIFDFPLSRTRVTSSVQQPFKSGPDSTVRRDGEMK